MRGENLNFPINGVRPDPLFVNIIRVVNDAASRQDVLNAFGSFSLTPQNPSMMGPFGGAPDRAGTGSARRST